MPSLPIKIKEVTFRYGSTVALSGVSLDIEAGKRFGLIGPNGGGKSTLMALLSTATAPQEGQIFFGDKELAQHLAWVRSQIGVVFQSGTLDKKLTVYENLHLMGRLQGLSQPLLGNRVDELISRLDLKTYRDTRSEKLSGGTKRRAELALSLLHSPAVLLLDEPTTGLDPAMRREFWTLLSRVETTVLFATHFLDEAEFCDRVALIDKGRVVATGNPFDLGAKFNTDVVTIQSRDPLRLSIAMNDALNLKTEVMVGEVRLEREKARDLIPSLMERWGNEIVSVSVKRSGLESFFLQKVEEGRA